MYVRAIDENGNAIVLNAGGILAVFRHESDPNLCRLRHSARPAAFIVRGSPDHVASRLSQITGKPVEDLSP